MRRRLRTWWRRGDPGFLLALAITFLALWPFLSRASLPQATDAELHIFRLHELSQLIRGGEVYPRWAPDFYHAYGYPIFNYYAPLAYYLGLGVELLPRLDAVAGVKFVFMLSLLLGGIGTYGFVRDHWGRSAGYVAAAVFVYAPYVQYIDPHARGVLAESLSLGLFPLALWGLSRWRRRPRAVSWMITVFLIAAVILSHNLMALLFFGLLTAWATWQSVVERDPEGGRRLAMVLLLGLGMAAFFWLPVYLEREAVDLTTLVGEGDNFDFRTHFLSLGELLAPTRRLDWGATEPAFRFNLGIAQWVLALLGVGAWLTGWARQRRHLTFFVLATAVLIFLMLPPAAVLWETAPLLPFFQFPWRLLGATAAMLAVLAGAGAATLAQLVRARWSERAALGVTAGLVLFPILLGLPLTQPAPWAPFGPVSTGRMSDIENTGRWLGTTSTADYVPATVEMLPPRKGQLVVSLYENEPVDRVNWAQVPPGTEIRTEWIRPLFTRYRIEAPQPFRFRLFIFDFPGWQVRVDGERVETELGRPEGFIVVPLSAGQHVVEVEFGGTPARRAAWAISGAALLLTVAGAFLWGKRSRTRPAPARSWQRLERWVATAVVGLILLYLAALRPAGWLHFNSTEFTAQPAQQNVLVHFGDQIALIGYDTGAVAAAPGEAAPVTLYWKAKRPLQINYQVFLHLLGPDGRPVAQSDKLHPGNFPTRRWPLDAYVRDEHTLHLPPELSPGEYQMSVGLWVQAEGWRLPVLNEAGEQAGDTYTLFTLQVK